jgi:nicotinamide-nucleotide amidase
LGPRKREDICERTLGKQIQAQDVDFVRIDEDLINRAIATLTYLKTRGRKAVSAESCTGGLIATVLSEAPGAAEYFEGGFVVYTPAQKSSALKVPQTLIKEHGTVSPEVAVSMAEGALKASDADIAVSVTGVAGPEPDENGNPVGLVYFGCAQRGQVSFHQKREFANRGRAAVRRAAAEEALAIMQRCARDE